MGVPDEWSFELREFHILTVEFTYDFGGLVFVD